MEFVYKNGRGVNLMRKGSGGKKTDPDAVRGVLTAWFMSSEFESSN